MGRERLNDLAIILTKKIDAEIVRLCAEVTRAAPDTLAQAPNFFHIRERILATLESYMDVITVRTESSPGTEERYSPEIIKQIRNAELEKEAGFLVKAILQSPDHFARFEFNDEWDRFRSVTKDIVVLKTALIDRESR